MGINTLVGYKVVHPTFLYESICSFIIFLILRGLQKKRKFKGQILISYFLLYSGIRFIIEGFRTDSLMIYSFKVSRVLSLIIFIATIVFLCIKRKKIKQKTHLT